MSLLISILYVKICLRLYNVYKF